MSRHARSLQETHTCPRGYSPIWEIRNFPRQRKRDKDKMVYLAENGGHLCHKKVTDSETAYIFFVAKDGKEDHKWKNPHITENCPRGRQHEFCPNCRRIPEEEYKDLGLGTHPKNECWQCMCS